MKTCLLTTLEFLLEHPFERGFPELFSVKLERLSGIPDSIPTLACGSLPLLPSIGTLAGHSEGGDSISL